MSIVVRYPPSGVTRQQYDSVRGALEAAGDWRRTVARFTFSSVRRATSG
jgi:hypothetical protein